MKTKRKVSVRKIINKKQYKLWDAYDTKSVSTMRAVEVMTVPSLKSKYDSVRCITKGDTLAIYVR